MSLTGPLEETKGSTIVTKILQYMHSCTYSTCTWSLMNVHVLELQYPVIYRSVGMYSVI